MDESPLSMAPQPDESTPAHANELTSIQPAPIMQSSPPYSGHSTHTPASQPSPHSPVPSNSSPIQTTPSGACSQTTSPSAPTPISITATKETNELVNQGQHINQMTDHIQALSQEQEKQTQHIQQLLQERDEQTQHIQELLQERAQQTQQIQELLQERAQQTQELQNLNEELEGRVQQRTSQLSRVINQLKQEIGERKQAERALQQSQVKLIHSEKMSGLGQMVAGIAHEINNPVNFIHGNLKHVQTHVQEILTVLEVYQSLYPEPEPELQAIADDVDIEFLSKDIRKIVSSMQIGTNRILDIVRSLRTFSRMDQVEFKPMDIHEGIESTLLILKHRLKAQPGRPQVVVLKQYAGNLPLVDCQAGQINQVLMNILANALDALDESGELCAKKGEPPMLIISTQQTDPGHIAIQLSDNGPGIPKEVQQRLFDPFFTTKPVGKGTGLGMSISYTIITENHGGRLQLVSTSGQGASFLIELPIKQNRTQF